MSITGSGKQMELIYPHAECKNLCAAGNRWQAGKNYFYGCNRKPGSKIFWHLDDEYIGTTINFHQMALSPSPGKHLLTIVDENGESVSREFEILEKEK